MAQRSDHPRDREKPLPRSARSRGGSLRHAAVVGVVLLALGCGPESTPPPAEPTEEPTAEPTAEPTEEPTEDPDDADDADEEDEEPDLTEPVVVEQTVWNFDAMEEVDLRVVVHPFVRVPTGEDEDGLLNGLITYEVTSPDGEYHLERYGVHPHEVRVVDTEAMTLSFPAYATDGTSEEHLADVEQASARAGDGPVRWAGVHRDPGTDATAVLLPYLGLIEDVGIVDAEEVDTSDYLPVQDALSELVEVHETTWDLQVHRERADGDVQIRESDHEATITLDSDILFDIDEHTLTDDTDAALQATAEELERADGGELEIIGHTDDVRSLEHNQQLSEDRAEAVHQRLGELTDLEDFTVSTDGRAFHEPVASNDSDQGRALNRRVELHYTPGLAADSPSEESDDGDTSGDDDVTELPPTDGPVGTADEPITVSGPHGGAVEVTVEEVRPAGDLLVGRVRVEVTEPFDGEEHAGPLARALSFGDLGMHEGHDNPYSPGHQVDALTLLVGDERQFPLELGSTEHVEGSDRDGFIIEHGDPWRVIAGDRGFGHDADAEVGAWAVATVLWPTTGQDEVVVDVPGRSEHAERPWSQPWRAVDVPVEAEH
ncbi:OmpA family protein [Nesterenkonia sp. K-15-9-6]|uniref:OmpA family protein n=1 Tax=Nesterenkonia sp. K-15-9-6 TaxID=3093918 RepID=UPI0040442E82